MLKWYMECPYCWESIRENSKKCSYCWEFLLIDHSKAIINLFDKKYNRMSKKQYFIWALILVIATIILLCLTAWDFLNLSLIASTIISFGITAYPFARIFTLRAHDFWCSWLIALIFFIPLFLIIASMEKDSLSWWPVVWTCFLVINVFVLSLVLIDWNKTTNKYWRPSKYIDEQ